LAIIKLRKPVILEKIKVIKRKEYTPDLFLMWLERPEGFNYKSGKYCTIGVEGVERAYSIASAPHEKYLELFIERIPEPEGKLTPLLYKLDIGDTVTIRPRAKGLFTLDETFTNHVMVATVTGVAPFVSYIRDYLHNGHEGNNFHVLEGASYFDEFVYDAELEEISKQYPSLLSFISTISRPDEEHNREWKGKTGRVNMIVEDYVENLGFKPENTLIYACGHPDMIEDVKDRMAPKGFKVKFERFWKED